LIVVHPAVAGGKRCNALTTHLDIAPTLLSMATPATEPRTARGLPGKDFSPLLLAPESAKVDAARSGSLFCYNMFAYLDGDFLYKAVDYLHKGGNPKQLKEAGIAPDFRKRGAVRAIHDGRYTFARYFSPKQHNRPTTLEQLRALNDVELYDAERDPDEMVNLAMGDGNRELLMAMNEKLNGLIDAEVGEDVGQMLPGGIEAGWEVTPETMAGA